VRITYRPEIDGLRAISVFAIIIYHANFIFFDHWVFQGGFIGVDIFFVISGYLITTLILKEINKTNQFSYKKFYERRIRRILPALLFVIIITSIISYIIFLPTALIDFAKSVISIIFFSSNIYFWVTGGKYGADSELLRPLVHTWSLSIEEQFYILFPIFLITIIKSLKQKVNTHLFIIFSFSLIFAQWSSGTDLKVNFTFFKWEINFFEKFNFYCLQSRIFELLTGSLLSYFKLNNGGGKKSYSILNQICPSLGIVLILYSFLFFNFSEILHPSFITIIPIAGVSLIIWFSTKGELVTEILSSKIFLFFGLISYSLYLWHYPIFTFLRYVDVFNNSPKIKLLAIILTIILSLFSYYFIEKPFRNKNIISIKILTIYTLISVIILLSYSFYIFKTEGSKSKFPNIVTEKLTIDRKDNELNSSHSNLNNVLLIGDSHADALTHHLNKELNKLSYNFYKLDGYYLKNFNLINRKNNVVDANYIRENEKIDKFLEAYKNLIVVWHQRWSIRLLEEYFDNKEGYTEYQNEENRYTEQYLQPININTKTLEQRQRFITEGIKSSAKNILEKGHILILVYPVPEMGFDVPRLFNTNYANLRMSYKKMEVPILTGSYDVYKKRNKIIFETLDSIQGPNVYRVYPHKSFCDTAVVNRCVANNKEHLFYYDDDHLSLWGSKYVVNDIIRIIQQQTSIKVSR
jgi:peptidoglycan/LPS O-acetylase OafA/YrhL